MRRHSTGKTDVAWTSINFLKYVGPGWPSAGYTKVDRWKGMKGHFKSWKALGSPGMLLEGPVMLFEGLWRLPEDSGKHCKALEGPRRPWTAPKALNSPEGPDSKLKCDLRCAMEDLWSKTMMWLPQVAKWPFRCLYWPKNLNIMLPSQDSGVVVFFRRLKPCAAGAKSNLANYLKTKLSGPHRLTAC